MAEEKKLSGPDFAGSVVKVVEKAEKRQESGELSHNSSPLGGGCRRMTPWRWIAGVEGQEKVRWRS